MGALRVRLIAVIFAAIAAALPVTAWAQAETGRITGRVVDAQGAAVPGAAVTATGAGSGVTRSTVTDAEGLYVIPNLQPATYEVRVELSGFRGATATTRVPVGGSATVDVALQVGAVAETVQVVASAEPLVNVRTQEVVTNVTETQLRELPTLTRDPYDLVTLAGTASDQDPSARGAGFSLNGLRASGTNILLDGAANNDEFTGSVGQSVPLDAVQEFSVISNNFLPQYGRATAGVVNLVVKSGTNAFRGSAYEYFRNDKMATNTFENKARGVEKGEFDRNQYGFSLGGPIRRERAFFFGNFEGIRVRSVETETMLVPTPEFLAQTAANTRQFFSRYDLASPISGGFVTRGEIGGTAGGPFASLPANVPVFGLVQRSLPADAGGGDPQNTGMFVGRVDWALNNSSQFYARYAMENEEFLAGSNAFSPYTGFDTGETNKNHNVLASLTNIWSSRFTTQTKVVFSRLENTEPLGEQAPGPTLYMRSTATRVNGLRVAFPGYLPFNPGSAIPFGGPQNFLQLYEEASWLKGNHDLRFGGTFVHMRDNRTFGAFQNSVMTLGANVNQALDNLVAGQLLQFQGAIDPQGKFPGETVTLPAVPPQFSRNNRYNEWALYFNDAWAATPRLTLNLGLRYEYFGVQHNADPRLDSNFYYGSGSNIFEQVRNGRAMIAPDSPAGGLWRPDYNNFAPRVGFAWDVTGDGRTSLRGGYGIGYERNFGNVTFNVIQNPPAYAVVSVVAGTDVPSIPITTDNAGPLAGTGQAVLPRTSLRHVNENIVNAYAHLWSLSVQRQLGNGIAASIDYTGSRGVKLYTLEDPNAPGSGAVYLNDASPVARLNPQYSNLNTRGNNGRSLFNGLIFGLDARQLGNTGLSLTGRYTLGFAKDNLSTTFSESNNNFNLGLLDPFNPDVDWGWADYDVRHRVSVGGIWQMPFLRGRGGVAEAIAGGWQVSTIFTAQSGAPFSVYDCTNGVVRCIRMLRVGDLPTRLADPRPTSDPNTFVYMDLSGQAAGAGTYVHPITGTSDFGPFPETMTERNTFRRPGRWNVDAIASKRFAVAGRSGLQVRFEAYNVFNHANLFIRDDQTDLSSSTEILAFRGDTGVGDGAPEGDGQRRLQVAVRFDW